MGRAGQLVGIGADGRGGSTRGTVQGDPGTDRATVAASTAREDGMKMQTAKLGHTKSEGVGRGTDLSATKQPVTSETIIIYGCMAANLAENP